MPNVIDFAFHEHHHDYKQLLDEVFVISGIIKVEVSVIGRSRRLRLITLTEIVRHDSWEDHFCCDKISCTNKVDNDDDDDELLPLL